MAVVMPVGRPFLLCYAKITNKYASFVISLCKILPGGTAEPADGGRIADLDFLALESKENLEKKSLWGGVKTQRVFS
jgi:hypothetical protein